MLHFFGCSVTYGEELSDRYSESYPVLISKALNQHFHNYARCGNDDFTSINTFFRLFNNGYISGNDIVFFQWSGMRRHGLPFGKTVVQYPWIETALGKWDERSKDEQNIIKGYTRYINDKPLMELNANMRLMFTAWSQTRGNTKFIFYEMDDSNNFIRPSIWLRDSFLGYTDGLGIKRCRDGHPSAEGHARWAEYLLESLR